MQYYSELYHFKNENEDESDDENLNREIEYKITLIVHPHDNEQFLDIKSVRFRGMQDEFAINDGKKELA